MNGAALALYAFVVFLGIVVIATASIIVRTLRNGVPPMPSSGRVRGRLIEVVKELSPARESTVVELGSGWGGLGLELSRSFPAGTVIGYENSPVPFLFSLAVRRLLRASNLRLVRANFTAVSLREADLIVCYLSPEAMSRLQPKFSAELKPSAVVVSSTFALPVWKPQKVLAAGDIYRSPIYVYVAGVCRSAATGGHIDMLTPP